MRRFIAFKKLLLILGGWLIAFSSLAQERAVTGIVTDAESKEPLTGATVLIKGTTTGITTDIDGAFTINAKDGDVLLVSFVGYLSEEIVIGGQTQVSFSMTPDLQALEEVVVIGYGTVKKTDATGSVEVVTSEDFNKGAISSPQELLMGKSAGVMIAAPTGQPGVGSAIRIRGGSSLRANNDPLIVIDGVPVTINTINGLADPLSTINPNDIESFTVLKDASATAIYGSRASNGVIIITTKKGKSNKLKISYNSNVSVGVPTKFVDVLSADEFREAINTNEDIPAVAKDLLGTDNTDWQKEIYQNSVSTDQNISFSGKIKDVLPFHISGGYTLQNGILKETQMDRSTVSIGLSPSFFDDHLKVNLNVKGMSIGNNFSNTAAIGDAINFDPTKPVRDGNTTYGGYYTWTGADGKPNFISNNNPVALIDQKDNTSNAMRSLGNLQLNYKFHFLPELSANLNVGYDYFKSEGKDNTAFEAPFAYRSRQTNVKSFTDIGKNKLLDVYFNYLKELPSISSKIDVTGGYSYQNFYDEEENSNRPWVADSTGTFFGADTTLDKTENTLISFFGRFKYNLLDRYLITFTIRQDGSSRFAEDNRWGLFPSAAFAWKINEEFFLRDVESISDLKLRLGWGITGQQDILGSGGYPENYPYLARYDRSESTHYYRLGDKFYQLWKPAPFDSQIKWEETTTQNIGIDFGLFNNRLIGSVDYYKRITNDLLNEIPVAVGTNFANRLITNVGSLENKGIELTLNGKIISKSKVSWEIGMNFTKNVNKITKLTAFEDPNYTGYQVGEIRGGSDNRIQINNVGLATNTFYLFKQVYDNVGMPLEGVYVDKTEKGGAVEGNDLNRYASKTPTPDYMIGVSSRFAYGNFDLSFSGRLSIGNYVYNNIKSDYARYSNLYDQSGYIRNIISSVKETNFFNAQYKSDVYLEDGSFFRMDNISAGYYFENFFTDKLNAKLSLTVQNAFVITQYSGLDPEISNTLSPGIDNNLYPRPRTFILGLNVNF